MNLAISKRLVEIAIFPHPEIKSHSVSAMVDALFAAHQTLPSSAYLQYYKGTLLSYPLSVTKGKHTKKESFVWNNAVHHKMPIHQCYIKFPPARLLTLRK